MRSSFLKKYKHISTGDSGVHMPLFFDFQLNTKITSKTTKYAYETLTCQSGVIREYTFQNLPSHATSIPVIGGATSNAFGCYVIRDFSNTGKVKVYSPVSQDVVVYLILLM